MNKPLATIGDAVLHGGPAWRAQMRANGIERRPPPSSAVPDRGYIEQPGEAEARKPPSPPPSAKADEAAKKEPVTEKKRTRVVRGEEFQLRAVRRVLELGEAQGAQAKVAAELGVNASLISSWLAKHAERVRAEMKAESKTLVSTPAAAPASPPQEPKPSAGGVDIAAKNLVEMLGIYIRAMVAAQVDEAVKERMKRLL